MKHKIHILTALTAIALLSSCDVTEDGFKPIDRSSLRFAVNVSALQFGAQQGSTAEFTISGNVPWVINCNDSHFSFSRTSGDGDATVTVTAERNSGSDRLQSSFQVVGVDGSGFEHTVSMEQNIVLFPATLGLTSYNFPQEGGEHSIELSCSVDWMFEIEGTDQSKEGFHILPGESGPGVYRPFDVTFVWGPNYTLDSRSVTLQFMPVHEQDQMQFVGDLPPAITLTQDAGTLPQNISLTLGAPSYTECTAALRFASVAPVEECGVILTAGADAHEFRIAAPLASADSREVTWTITGLTENTKYTVTPYVISKVGEVRGSAQSIQTEGSEPSEDDNDPVKPI